MNPPFFHVGAIKLHLAVRFSPDEWSRTMRLATRRSTRARITRYIHASKAYWVNINGKWVPRDRTRLD